LPYLYKRRFLDTQYGIRNDGYLFKIGYSTVLADTDSDIKIKGKIKGRQYYELLTRKNVVRNKITTDDLKICKKILDLNNAHLNDYQPDADIQITRSSKLRPSSSISSDDLSTPRYDAVGQNTDGR